VISNMPVARRVVHAKTATTTFRRTPKMPTYLVEFTGGDMARITARSDGIELGVWAVRGQEQDGRVALANAQQILADYNDYFGFRYPLPKLDSIAVPGGFSGAMENWGAITYNDQLLLLTASSTIRNRQAVFSVQAHEMAHQWNGDLVTMGWWDDIWLNESFASWRAAKETDLRNPAWNWWEGEDEAKENAMSADARVTSHAIQQHVTDELQVTNAFDPSITYNKGQAVLRMLEAYLGPDVFRDGIRVFMRTHAYSNATSTDLWNALGKVSARDVGAIAAGWIEQPGFPLVSVTARCDAAGQRSITLAQQRFLLQGSDPAPSHWSVPLQIRSGAAGTPQALLLTAASQDAPAGRCGEPLSVNAGAIGYYRATYDPETLRQDAAAFGTLPHADRIALLDDEWALVQAWRPWSTTCAASRITRPSRPTRARSSPPCPARWVGTRAPTRRPESRRCGAACSPTWAPGATRRSSPRRASASRRSWPTGTRSPPTTRPWCWASSRRTPTPRPSSSCMRWPGAPPTRPNCAATTWR